MKKLLTFMLLLSGMNMFGAAYGMDEEEYNYVVKRPLERGFAVIINTTDLDNLSTNTFEENVYNPAATEGGRYRLFAKKNISFSKERPWRTYFDNIRFGNLDPKAPFPVYSTKDKQTAKFISPQEPGKIYLLMENKWDDDTDYVIISEEDFERTEKIPPLIYSAIKAIEKSIDEGTFSEKDLEALKIMPPLLLTDKINRYVEELKKQSPPAPTPAQKAQEEPKRKFPA